MITFVIMPIAPLLDILSFLSSTTHRVAPWHLCLSFIAKVKLRKHPHACIACNNSLHLVTIEHAAPSAMRAVSWILLCIPSQSFLPSANGRTTRYCSPIDAECFVPASWTANDQRTYSCLLVLLVSADFAKSYRVRIEDPPHQRS